MTTTERERLGDLPVTAALTARDRRLAPSHTVADAKAVFRNESVQVLPVVTADGRYLGAVDRAALDGREPGVTIDAVVDELLPVVRAGTTTTEALSTLDRHGGTRLIVVEDDGVTYRGLVCLRSDRVRLCIESECHDAG